MPLFWVSEVYRYKARPCWSTRKGALALVLVDVLIRAAVSVVEPVPVLVSDVDVARAASAVDVPVISPGALVAGATDVSVFPVTGTDSVG